MSTLYDGSIEAGRFDLIYVDREHHTPVDVNLVLHVVSDNDEMFARKLLEATVSQYGSTTAHVRVKVYVAEFNSVLVYLTDAGYQKWSAQLAGEMCDAKPARQHYATEALAHYKACMREYAQKPFCTHEVCYADGSAVYWAGE
jgi:hypothetical protein